MGLTGMVNTLAHMKLMQGALANNAGSMGDYKALVVLFLFGAKDANNFLMPGLLHPSRANYDTHRGVLALPTGGGNPTHPIVASNLAADPSAPAGAELGRWCPPATCPALGTTVDHPARGPSSCGRPCGLGI